MLLLNLLILAAGWVVFWMLFYFVVYAFATIRDDIREAKRCRRLKK